MILTFTVYFTLLVSFIYIIRIILLKAERLGELSAPFLIAFMMFSILGLLCISLFGLKLFGGHCNG